MNKIIVSTESCSDLTKEMCEEHGVYVVPMHVIFDGKSYDDGEIPVQKVYDFYNSTKRVPSTSAVNPAEFTAFFEKISAENNNAPIVHIGYSSVASCTYQNAVISLEEHTMGNVFLIDSKNVSGGACNITMYAISLRDENPDITPKELVEKINLVIPKVATVFLPDNLDYLTAGGRVSNAAALCANILRIKPRIDIINGSLIAGRKYRGSMTRAVLKLAKDFTTENHLVKDKIYIMYAPGMDMTPVEALENYLRDFGFKEVILVTTGCIMTAHGGPGAIGISAIRKE